MYRYFKYMYLCILSLVTKFKRIEKRKERTKCNHRSVKLAFNGGVGCYCYCQWHRWGLGLLQKFLLK